MSKLNFQHKLQTILSMVVLLSATALAGTEPAAAVNRASLQLDTPVTVAGTQLQSGNYRVEWTGNGDQAEVTIYQGKKAVVSMHARETSGGTGAHNLIGYSGGENGTKFLKEIFFSKQKVTLTLGEAIASGEERAKK